MIAVVGLLLVSALFVTFGLLGIILGGMDVPRLVVMVVLFAVAAFAFWNCAMLRFGRFEGRIENGCANMFWGIGRYCIQSSVPLAEMERLVRVERRRAWSLKLIMRNEVLEIPLTQGVASDRYALLQAWLWAMRDSAAP